MNGLNAHITHQRRGTQRQPFVQDQFHKAVRSSAISSSRLAAAYASACWMSAS
jgi:hypothetical protein